MSDDLSKRIGVAVAAARKQAGLSQAEFGDRIGLHVDSVSNIERGVVLPTIATLMAMAADFNMSVIDLLPPPAGHPKPSARRLRLEAEIREILRTLPEKRLEVARDHLALVAQTP